MLNQFIRTQLIFGAPLMAKLRQSRIAVFGIGGVGSFTAEALVRSGIGTLDIIDDDRIALSNLNRQLFALHSTLGLNKVDAAEARLKDIAPEVKINKHKCFYLPETAGRFDFTQYDYIIDAIDTVTGKLEIIMRAKEAGTPVISAMGAGNKVDPTALRVGDISETSVCPLARIMRKELRKRGISKLKVVYSIEPPIKPYEYDGEDCREEPSRPDIEAGHSSRRRETPGSNAFVPSVAGLIIAAEVIKDLTQFTAAGRIKGI
jgi:tRNA A37 threonylcarbamoyladenosine dehydratase